MELIEHEVIIDNNIIVKLKIPKVITAMELKALSMKAEKMFKLSDAMMPTATPSSIPKGRPSKGMTSLFTDEMANEIISMRDNEKLGYDIIASEINAKYDMEFTKDNVQAKYYNQKNRKKTQSVYSVSGDEVPTRGRKSELWNEEKLQYLKKMINSHVSYKEKTQRLNRKFGTDFTSTVIQKKYYNLKQNNKWDSIKVSQDE